MSVYLQEIQNYLRVLDEKAVPAEECLQRLKNNSAVHWDIYKIYASLLSQGKTHKEIIEHFCKTEEEYILNNCTIGNLGEKE